MADNEKFLEILKDSHKIVFFGGAGVSTESGIPDFRSKDGLYNKKDIQFEDYEPEYLLSEECLATHPDVFFEFYRQKLDTRNIEPNVTHKVLAKLEEMGKFAAVITQNIDGLHQKAGSKKVYEIHGTAQKCHCIRCGKEYPGNYVFDSTDPLPVCDCVKDSDQPGISIRPDIVLYGENLPKDAVDNAISAIETADCLIIAGTSLNVYPAASFINNFFGKHCVIINREPIGKRYLGRDELHIEGSLGDTFSYINDHLDELKCNLP